MPVGSIVRLTSKIVKTTQPDPVTDSNAKAHIKVKAEVEEIETGVSVFENAFERVLTNQNRRETNTFYFTMAKEDGKPFGKVVIPETYHETMYFLEGERRLAVGSEMRRLYAASLSDSPDTPPHPIQ